MGVPEQASRSRTDALRALAWRLSTPWGLVAMFGVALLIRLLLAPYTGFWGDLAVYRSWVTRLHDVGLHDFYSSGPPAEYPPGYLYVLWLISHVSTAPGYLLLKLPSIVADLGLAWIAGTYAARLAPQPIKERWPVRTLVAAAVLFNPAVLALSAVWGQVDAVPAMFVLWSLLLLIASPPRLRYEIAAFLLFAVAISIKPQSAFVVPVMLYVLYRRHLYRRSALGDDRRRSSHRPDRGRLARRLARLGAAVRPRTGVARPVQRRRRQQSRLHQRERLQPVGRRRILAQRLGRRPRRLLRRHLCLPHRPAALRRRNRRGALADPRGDRARRARGNRAHDRRRKRRAPRLRAPDADARALHVPRSRRLRPADLPAAAPDRVRGALGALPARSLGAVRVLQHGLVARPGLPLQPVVRLAPGRVRRPIRGRRRSGPPSSPRSRSSSRGAAPAGPGRSRRCKERSRRRRRRLPPPRRLLPACARRRPASPGANRHQGWPHAGARSRSSGSRASSSSPSSAARRRRP